MSHGGCDNGGSLYLNSLLGVKQRTFQGKPEWWRREMGLCFIDAGRTWKHRSLQQHLSLGLTCAKLITKLSLPKAFVKKGEKACGNKPTRR